MSANKKLTGLALAAAAAAVFAVAPVSTAFADGKVKCMSDSCKGMLVDKAGKSLNNSCKGVKNAIEVESADFCKAAKGTVVS